MNPTVINQLPQVQSTSAQYSVLARLDGKAAWTFLVQPAEITWERNANYSGSNAVGTIPNLQWNNTDGWVVSISNLPLSTLWQERSLTKYVDDLAALALPDTNSFSPPVLAFRWGQRSLSPVVLTRFSKTERGWFKDGTLAECSVSFAIAQVPSVQVVSA